MKNRILLVTLIMYFITYIWGVIVLGYVWHTARTDYGLKTMDLRGLTQLNRDWASMPFVDIKTVKLSQAVPDCPATHPIEVLTETWLGMHYVCDCLHRKRGKKAYSRYSLDRRCNKGDDANENDCLDQNAMFPIVMSNIKGYKVCGKQGSVPFMIAQRPTGKNGQHLKCAEGWLPCDPKGSLEHTYCYPQMGSVATDCPITSLTFDTDDIESIQIQRKGTQLPLIGTSLSTGQPCKNTSQRPKVKGSQLNVGEVARSGGFCEDGDRDDSWQKSRLSISEYDLQAYSGVLDVLEETRHYTHSVFPGSSIKKEIMYEAYTRSIMHWSLQCELKGKTRQKAQEILKQAPKSNEPITRRGLLISALMTHLIAPISTLGFGPYGFFIGCPIGHLVSAGLVFGHFRSLSNYMEQLEADIDWLKTGNLDFISECIEISYLIPDKDDLMTVVRRNRDYASKLYVYLYSWLISCALVPVVILLLILCVNCRCSLGETLAEAPEFITNYLLLN